MRRTLMFDQLETRKLLTEISPNWDPYSGWHTVYPTEPGYLDPADIARLVPDPIYVAPPLPIVYPYSPEPYDFPPNGQAIYTAP